jgi:hypothetical protein
MELFSILNSDYNKILIVATEAPIADKLAVYHQNKLLGYFKTNNHIPQDDFTYFAKTLNFQATQTSLGVRYIFEIEPSDLDMVDYFKDFVYHFELSTTMTAYPLFGLFSDKGVVCCIAKKIKKAQVSEACNASQISNNMLEVYSFIVAAKFAIKAKDFKLAVCASELISSLCNPEDCGC